jgi:hypothetical protein
LHCLKKCRRKKISYFVSFSAAPFYIAAYFIIKKLGLKECRTAPFCRIRRPPNRHLDFKAEKNSISVKKIIGNFTKEHDRKKDKYIVNKAL